jgi:hypothetical protein
MYTLSAGFTAIVYAIAVLQAATLGDPRRPADIQKYVRSTEAGEGPHTLGLLSLVMAVASMAIKVNDVQEQSSKYRCCCNRCLSFMVVWCW